MLNRYIQKRHFLYTFSFYINIENFKGKNMYEQLLYQEKFNIVQNVTDAYINTAENFFLMEQDVKKKKKVYYSLKQLLHECPFYGLETYGENFIC
jgi:hypothetical protein